jgi:hypothetical protein
MRQGLLQRHIQMIALAGTIGTGLFLGSGSALTHAGPLGAFLSYTIVGMAVASVCLAIGELGSLMPLTGDIIRCAETFFDPALSFADVEFALRMREQAEACKRDPSAAMQSRLEKLTRETSNTFGRLERALRPKVHHEFDRKKAIIDIERQVSEAAVDDEEAKNVLQVED